jgi:hypothetical protein
MDFPLSPPSPSWIDFAPDSVRGLDLLGLRLPAQTIGYALFNGVTTISPKVRYLCFRAFLVDAYRTFPEPPPDSNDEFLEFARKAESALTIAHALVANDVTNVVGIDQARLIVEDGDDLLPLDNKTGQLAMSAYAGPARDLGLVGLRDPGAPSIDRRRGQPLAELLRETWGATSIGARILRGEDLDFALREELEEFGEACRLDVLPEAERDLLLNAILPESPYASEIERVRTYALLLHLAKEREDLGRPLGEEDVMLAAGRPGFEPHPSLLPALDGWLIYQIRDSLAVAHEAALGEVVSALGASSGGMHKDRVIQELLRDATRLRDLWTDLGLPDPGRAVSSLSMVEVQVAIAETCSGHVESKRGLVRWSGGVNEWELMAARKRYGTGVLLLLPLSWILADRRASEGVREALPLFEGLSLRGSARLGVAEIVLPRLARYLAANATLGEVMADLVTTTVYQHSQIVLSRLAQDPRRDVAVLNVEGDHWVKRRGYAPGRTASRLYQAIGWLEQLGLTDGNTITEAGQEQLERALNVLERVDAA